MQDKLLDDTFVVVNSDTIIDVDIGAVVEQHAKRGALCTMVLRPSEEGGPIELDATGRIRRILGQGESTETLRAMNFCGVHVIEPRFLEYIPPDVESCVVRYAYTKALSNDEIMFGSIHEGFWADAGTPASLLAANEMAMTQKLELAYADPLGGFAIAPKKDVADVVRMGEDVTLGTGANVRPPALLGDGCKIGDAATVGPAANLGARVAVGKGATVTNALVLPGVKLEAGETYKDCILHPKATLQVE